MLVGWERLLYSHLHVHAASQRHNNKDRCMKDNAGRKTHEERKQEDFFTKIFTSHFIARFERVVQGLHVRGCWRPNINFIFWPHCYDRHVESFLFSLDERSLGSTAGCCFLYCILASSLDPSSSGLHAPSAWCGFPYHISSLTLWKSAGNCSGTQTQLNYIIIQRPHDRPMDLWNRMFNRHQAEITVMQFRGYSLPVHPCSGTMGPSPCPIS